MDPQHLKIKEQDISLTKNYCITVDIQKTSLIHKLILQIEQILGTHELNGHTYFWPHPPKITEITFSCPEFAPACKISIHSIYSFLRYSKFPSSVNRLTMPIFNHSHAKFFWSTFNLCELVSTCRKSGYFIDLFQRLKNPAI